MRAVVASRLVLGVAGTLLSSHQSIASVMRPVADRHRPRSLQDRFEATKCACARLAEVDPCGCWGRAASTSIFPSGRGEPSRGRTRSLVSEEVLLCISLVLTSQGSVSAGIRWRVPARPRRVPVSTRPLGRWDEGATRSPHSVAPPSSRAASSRCRARDRRRTRD